MVNINDLLEKYFKAETSLAEEDVLKTYFKSGKINPEHLIYKALLDEFEMESKEFYPSDKKSMPQLTVVKSKHFWIRAFSISGIAASIIVAFWFWGNVTMADDYAVIKGKRINDAEYAQQFAIKKLSKVNQMLATTMKPIQNISKVNECLEPMEKFANINEQLEGIKNRINLKH